MLGEAERVLHDRTYSDVTYRLLTNLVTELSLFYCQFEFVGTIEQLLLLSDCANKEVEWLQGRSLSPASVQLHQLKLSYQVQREISKDVS